MNGDNRRHIRRFLLITAAMVWPAWTLSAGSPEDPPWKPGTEVRIDDPAAGTDGHFLVYIPTDYDARELWPVILYYHGLGGRPDTSLIRRVSNGKYCIVVGMSYYSPGLEGYRFLATEDVRILDHVLDVLKRHLSINDRQLYVSGFSKGGFYTCELLSRRGRQFAGAIILGAGSKNPGADYSGVAGKDVFMGCGEQDQFLAGAIVMRDRLTSAGATVTFEQWPGLGHTIGNAAGLRKWLFEQTVDRPLANAAPEPREHPSGSNPPSVAARDNAASHSAAWTTGAGLIVGITVLVFIGLWRRSKSLRTDLPSRGGSKES